MQASIACVLGLVTCHSNGYQGNMAARKLRLKDHKVRIFVKKISQRLQKSKKFFFQEFDVYKAAQYVVEWN